ncbi:putative thioredoxin [Aspergillus pseudocaelatus]|uniref:Thioredoxin n=1 Tax=Aspergillus pseudocaelatus TaxID=1825620 RepID=A0ABQ6WWX4_9EURO|nr:putative thioredoxin [Aspergillus pseudocaelatus]
MSSLTEIASKADYSAHLAALSPSALLILYFYTPWTVFKTQMTAGLTDLASQYPASTPPTISFVSIDAKGLLDIAKEYGVRVAPCVVCLRNGLVLESIRGDDPSMVRSAIERYTGIKALPIPAAPALTPEQLKQSKEALVTRLTELVKAAPVMLFMKGTPKSPQCRYSRRLVRILDDHSIEYGSYNVMADEDIRQGLKEFGDWPTFPQLWVDGELVGGLEIVREELSTNPNFMYQYLVNKPPNRGSLGNTHEESKYPPSQPCLEV